MEHIVGVEMRFIEMMIKMSDDVILEGKIKKQNTDSYIRNLIKNELLRRKYIGKAE